MKTQILILFLFFSSFTFAQRSAFGVHVFSSTQFFSHSNKATLLQSGYETYFTNNFGLNKLVVCLVYLAIYKPLI